MIIFIITRNFFIITLNFGELREKTTRNFVSWFSAFTKCLRIVKKCCVVFSQKFQNFSVTWLIARANAAMTVSQNDIHMIGGRNANGQLLKSVEYCEPGVIGKWKKAIG